MKGPFRLQSTLTCFISSDTASFLPASAVCRSKRTNAKALFKIQAQRGPATHPSPQLRRPRPPAPPRRPPGAHVTRSLPIGAGQVTSRPGTRSPARRRCRRRGPDFKRPPVASALGAGAAARLQRGGGLGEERTPPARMVLESVARIVKVQLPAYLKRLPVPESITGFARLTGNPHLHAVPVLARFPRRGRGGRVCGGVQKFLGQGAERSLASWRVTP